MFMFLFLFLFVSACLGVCVCVGATYDRGHACYTLSYVCVQVHCFVYVSISIFMFAVYIFVCAYIGATYDRGHPWYVCIVLRVCIMYLCFV
jgi:hypothetical protein